MRPRGGVKSNIHTYAKVSLGFPSTTSSVWPSSPSRSFLRRRLPSLAQSPTVTEDRGTSELLAPRSFLRRRLVGFCSALARRNELRTASFSSLFSAPQATLLVAKPYSARGLSPRCGCAGGLAAAQSSHSRRLDPLHLHAPQASRFGTDSMTLELNRAPAASSRASHSPHSTRCSWPRFARGMWDVARTPGTQFVGRAPQDVARCAPRRLG